MKSLKVFYWIKKCSLPKKIRPIITSSWTCFRICKSSEIEIPKLIRNDSGSDFEAEILDLTDFIILSLLWTIWCTLHSLMISITFASFLEKKLKHAFRFYRLFYNIIAAVSFFWIFLYSAGIKGPLVFQWSGWLQLIQIVTLLSSAVLFLAGGWNYDFLQFIGLRQIKEGTNHTSISETNIINTSGILGITRHPWYLGAVLFIWTINQDIYAASMTVKTIWTIYLIVGTLLEERKLVIEYGDEYLKYKQKVSMLFPFKALMNLWKSQR